MWRLVVVLKWQINADIVGLNKQTGNLIITQQ